MIMLAVLWTALWLGLAAASATVVLRVLPGINRLVADAVKPFACDICMSFWSTAIGCVVGPHFARALGVSLPASHFWVAGPASFAIALFVLRKITDPVGSFALPELKDSEPPAPALEVLPDSDQDVTHVFNPETAPTSPETPSSKRPFFPERK